MRGCTGVSSKGPCRARVVEGTTVCAFHSKLPDGIRPATGSGSFARKATTIMWGPIFLSKFPSECPHCAGNIASGRPVRMWNGNPTKPQAVHHHCTPRMADCPPDSLCSHPGCALVVSTSTENGVLTLYELCWLHRRGEAVQRGLGRAGDTQRRIERKNPKS